MFLIQILDSLVWQSDDDIDDDNDDDVTMTWMMTMMQLTCDAELGGVDGPVFGGKPATEVRISFTIIPHTTLVCQT
jgi:hypothetical protein